MSFSCAENERFNEALVALAEGKYDALVAAYAGKRSRTKPRGHSQAGVSPAGSNS